jgi:hypothetical protein
MKITIDNSRSLNEVQELFNDAFPFLKLEFCKGSAQRRDALGIGKSSVRIGEFRVAQTAGEIFISPSMTVFELERVFKEEYGLSICVYRKSGRSWLETVLTNDWTLQKQNIEGEKLSTLFRGRSAS